MNEKFTHVLTPGEAAERLRVTLRTVYLWLNAGKLRGFKIGGVWRIDPKDLPPFADKREP